MAPPLGGDLCTHASGPRRASMFGSLGPLGDSRARTLIRGESEPWVLKDSWYLPILQTRVGNWKIEVLMGQGLHVAASMTMQTAEALDDRVPVCLGKKKTVNKKKPVGSIWVCKG